VPPAAFDSQADAARAAEAAVTRRELEDKMQRTSGTAERYVQSGDARGEEGGSSVEKEVAKVQKAPKEGRALRIVGNVLGLMVRQLPRPWGK
jgi:hypothetical protein